MKVTNFDAKERERHFGQKDAQTVNGVYVAPLHRVYRTTVSETRFPLELIAFKDFLGHPFEMAHQVS